MYGERNYNSIPFTRARARIFGHIYKSGGAASIYSRYSLIFHYCFTFHLATPSWASTFPHVISATDYTMSFHYNLSWRCLSQPPRRIIAICRGIIAVISPQHAHCWSASRANSAFPAFSALPPFYCSFNYYFIYFLFFDALIYSAFISFLLPSVIIYIFTQRTYTEASMNIFDGELNAMQITSHHDRAYSPAATSILDKNSAAHLYRLHHFLSYIHIERRGTHFHAAFTLYASSFVFAEHLIIFDRCFCDLCRRQNTLLRVIAVWYNTIFSEAIKAKISLPLAIHVPGQAHFMAKKIDVW